VWFFRFFIPTGKFQNRTLIPQHSGSCAHIHQKSFAKGWEETEIYHLLSDRNVIGNGLWQERSKKLLGFILSRKAADEAEILSIAIDPKYRGRGMAAHLLRDHMNELSQLAVRRLFLEVDKHNQPACKLYDKFGFYKVGERPAYYHNASGQPSSALILRKDLA
jgi:ribosomal-protein-alanine N-acetyltransferase